MKNFLNILPYAMKVLIVNIKICIVKYLIDKDFFHNQIKELAKNKILLFAIALEAFIPLFEFKGQKFKHVTRNLVFVLTTGVVTITLAYLAFEVIRIEDYGYGLLNLVTLPVWVEMLLSLIVLDFFGQYFIHVCLHHNKWLWKNAFAGWTESLGGCTPSVRKPWATVLGTHG